jgi:hypothetical protein
MNPLYQTIIPTKFCQAEIPLVPTPIYTVPELTVSIMKSIDVTNTTGADIEFSLWLVPGGSSPVLANCLYSDQTVTPDVNLQWISVQVLNTTEQIWVQASNPGLVIQISGGEAS